MALFQIKYHTENSYETPLHEAYLEFMVMPCNNEEQYCTYFNFINNLSTPVQYVTSLYGFRIARFHLFGSVTNFNLTLEARVEKSAYYTTNYKSISLTTEQNILKHIDTKIKFNDFIINTSLTHADKFLYPTESYKGKTETVFKYLQRINNFVREYLQYELGVTTTTTSVTEIFRIRKGVCQDFAHLFISIMRTNTIPARYVSGYLNQGSGYIGSSAMHAWVEVWLPGTGWMGIDPTNNIFVNENYIKVAHGADYNDCMPIKGVIRSGGLGKTNYNVEVIEQNQ